MWILLHACLRDSSDCKQNDGITPSKSQNNMCPRLLISTSLLLHTTTIRGVRTSLWHLSACNLAAQTLPLQCIACYRLQLDVDNFHLASPPSWTLYTASANASHIWVSCGLSRATCMNLYIRSGNKWLCLLSMLWMMWSLLWIPGKCYFEGVEHHIMQADCMWICSDDSLCNAMYRRTQDCILDPKELHSRNILRNAAVQRQNIESLMSNLISGSS